MEVKAAFEEACGALNGDRRRAYEVFDGLFQMDRKALLMNPEKIFPRRTFHAFAMLLKNGRGHAHGLRFEKAYFYGEAFYVDERVLIPRYDTERSVDAILRLSTKAKRILEIGAGSGCVAITLGRLIPEAIINAADISGDALDVAKINKKMHGASNVHFIHSDLFHR